MFKTGEELQKIAALKGSEFIQEFLAQQGPLLGDAAIQVLRELSPTLEMIWSDGFSDGCMYTMRETMRESKHGGNADE